MSAYKKPLDDYPALAEWYARNAQRPLEGPSARLLFMTCEALRREANAATKVWLDSFAEFLAASAAPLKDFLAAEELAQRCDVDLLEIIGDLGETAVDCGAGSKFFAAMQHGAELTGLVVFRFLSAWTALNTGDFEACVDECEKITDPFASVHTIHGQALLELGRVKEALEALTVATTLAPGEVVAWFQKAKAHHVVGQHTEAIAALRECRRLAPQSDEVLVYLGMIASETPHAAEVWSDAWTSMAPHLPRFAGIPTVSLVLLRLAALIGDKTKAEAALAASSWADSANQKDIIQSLATTLRLLGQRGWMDVAATLLGRVTPAGEAC